MHEQQCMRPQALAYNFWIEPETTKRRLKFGEHMAHGDNIPGRVRLSRSNLHVNISTVLHGYKEKLRSGLQSQTLLVGRPKIVRSNSSPKSCWRGVAKSMPIHACMHDRIGHDRSAHVQKLILSCMKAAYMCACMKRTKQVTMFIIMCWHRWAKWRLMCTLFFFSSWTLTVDVFFSNLPRGCMNGHAYISWLPQPEAFGGSMRPTMDGQATIYILSSANLHACNSGHVAHRHAKRPLIHFSIIHLLQLSGKGSKILQGYLTYVCLPAICMPCMSKFSARITSFLSWLSSLGFSPRLQRSINMHMYDIRIKHIDRGTCASHLHRHSPPISHLADPFQPSSFSPFCLFAFSSRSAAFCAFSSAVSGGFHALSVIYIYYIYEVINHTCTHAN